MKTNGIAYIEDMIARRRLTPALSQLSEWIRENDLWQYSDEIERISTSYRLMGDYLLSGAADPSRAKFYDSIVSDLRALALKMDREVKVKESPAIYYATARIRVLAAKPLGQLIDDYLKNVDRINLAIQGGTKPPVALRQRKEEMLTDVFNYFWTVYPVSSDDAGRVKSLVGDPSMPGELSAQVVAGLLLGLIQHYDSARLNLLLDVYEQEPNGEVGALALTSAIIGAMVNKRRLDEDRLTFDRLKLLASDDCNYRRIIDILLEIIRTSDTDRINRTIREEVMPRFKEIEPDILKRIKDASHADDTSIEDNPEWQKIFEDRRLNDKMKELFEMQEEGADILMFPFSNLKNFHFFNVPANWFLPFDPAHSQVGAEGMEGIVPDFMMCDSDKYSLALSMAKMPRERLDMMRRQLEGQEEAIKEAQKDFMLKNSDTEAAFKRRAVSFLRDIYRFFRLFRLKNEFVDPLEAPVTLDRLTFVQDRLRNDVPTMRLLAEFYLKRKDTECALPIFLDLEEHGDADASDYEKIGYLYQTAGDWEKAMEYYSKAQLFNPESLWLIKRLAAVCRHLGRFDDAASYYSQALEAEPENKKLIMSLGACHLATGNYADALRQYYKIVYLDPAHSAASRAIAWVEFLNGNYDKSRNYHEIVLKDNPTSTDYLNAGHLELATQNYTQALDFYKKALASVEEGKGMSTIERVLKKDRNDLINAGVDPLVIDVIVDRLYK